MQSNKSKGALTAQINVNEHSKSGFDLSNNVLGTGKIGRIIPTRALHVMPGDTIKADSKVAVQFEPLAVPILANMDVKQEHFYVPYNIVWRNWDKFISGGEKMDYKGVVPNVSLNKIVQVINSQFEDVVNPAQTFDFPIISSKISDSNSPFKGNVVSYIDGDGIGFSQFVPNMKKALDQLGDLYYIKDLLKPQYEVLELVKERYKQYVDNEENLTPAFVTIPAATESKIDLFVNENAELFTSKYIQEILPAIKEAVNITTQRATIPTNYGVEWLLLWYEFYKPWIGIGSNLDYLNMCRLTPTDFIYAMTKLVYLLVSESDNVSKHLINLDVDFISMQPMSILNLRANYNIWYNNYRDILLEADAFEPVDTDEISDTEIFMLIMPRQRCWEKDAFTTALDTPGTGNVSVPINQVVVNEHQQGSFELLLSKPLETLLNKVGSNDVTIDNAVTQGNNIAEIKFGDDSWKIPTSFLSGINPADPISGIYNVTGFSLYALDAAQRAQKWLQKALFFGNRISDFYYMHFGVRFLDARLRLPELLTSSSELVKLDVIMNNTNITTEAGGEVFQSIAGDRAAYASAYDNGNSFDRFCEEHGCIMSYLTIMPQVTYAHGSNRDYSRLDQFDFAFSEFATLGMDAVYDSEITAISVDLPGNYNDIKVFGYQGKYYDYKAKHSEEHGELLDSQDMYTFSRKFNMYDPNGRPKLNYEFVHCFPDLDMFVVDSNLADYFRYDIRHSTAAERNLPSQSIYI